MTTEFSRCRALGERGVLLSLGMFVLTCCSALAGQDLPAVKIVRLPAGGVQGQARVDQKGTVHLIYLAGEAGKSDIFYMRWADGGNTFSAPLRVNSQAGSAIAMGTVRGAHLAIGRDARVHVAWMGSSDARPKGPGGATPMLYARLNDAADGFEPQRNVITAHPGLDGGGSIAADARGNVYVGWHAPTHPGETEQSRRVWVARSSDDGKTFAPEAPISGGTGACGCCGMRLFADGDGSLYALYRTADHMTQRDMTLLRVDEKTGKKESRDVGPMQSAVCVMSTSAFAPGPGESVLAAWEDKGQIEWADLRGAASAPAQTAPGRANNRKHPALACNAAGQTLLAWAEGTGWNKGGAVEWQLFDRQGQPLKGGAGRAQGLPAWGAPTAFARADGTFVVVY
jgi:hypothetical protein